MKIIRFFTILIFFACPAWPGDSKLIDFDLKDQFDQSYDRNSFDGKIVILLGADRQGSHFTDEWGPTLADSLRRRQIIDRIQFVAVADLHGVPGFMKKMIKGFFPKDKSKWCLMDWDGAFPQAYDFIKHSCNILVFNREKKLIFQQNVTSYDPRVATTILQTIETSLKSMVTQ